MRRAVSEAWRGWQAGVGLGLGLAGRAVACLDGPETLAANSQLHPPDRE